MKTTCLSLYLLLFIFPPVVIPQITKGGSEGILVDVNKPSVFLAFERVINAEPLKPDETNERYLVILHNNTKAEVSFCGFKVAKHYGDIGIAYAIAPVSRPITGSSSDENDSDPLPKVVVPTGYSSGNTCNKVSLASGRSIRFSIPSNHLLNKTSSFFISIKFEYGWESASLQGELPPTHIISYSFSSLPSEVRRKSIPR